MKVLQKLASLASSAEFAQAIPEIKAELSARQEQVSTLRKSIADAAFEPQAEERIATIRQQIREAEDGAATLETALQGTERRQRDLAKREAEDALSSQRAAALERRAALQEAWGDFDRHVAGGREAWAAIIDHTTAIRSFNYIAGSSGAEKVGLPAQGQLSTLDHLLTRLGRLSRAAQDWFGRHGDA